jgi:hypothetical protein
MRAKLVTGVLIGVAALGWGRSIEGQVQPVPGPGSGIVTVQGQVDVGRLPTVDVRQGSDWKVTLAQVADVRVVNALPFLRAGGRYEVTWPAGDRETFALAQLESGTWVRAASEGRPRWLNLATARTIEELP